MTRSHRWSRALGVILLAHLAALTASPAGLADPADPADPAPSEVAVSVNVESLPESAAVYGDSASAVAEACKQFGGALSFAATNYEEFAYATAGDGNSVDYQDPVVWQANVLGRTALREAAATALDASRTQGLSPEVSGPMQSWSLHATKLLVIMGLRGGGDSLNAAATELNTDAENTQMACALNGGHA